MFFRRSPHRYLAPALLAVIGIAGVPGEPLCAQQANADDTIEFDIPAQPLDTALAKYFQATGVQLLYDSRLTASRRSTAVRGRYSPRGALRQLLSGTGFVVRYTNANSAIITVPEEHDSTPLIPLGRVVVRERIGPARLTPVEILAYYQAIEGELREQLGADRRTSRLAFNLLVQLRISETGTLSDIVVARGSARQNVDRAVVDVLRDARVTPPSPLLEQPLRLSLKGIRN